MTRAHHSPPLKFRTLDDVVDVVRARGGRLSVPRRMILEVLFAATDPVSAEEIATEQRLELTSVYRNLEKLEEMGVLRHVHLGHGPGRYALVGRGSREYLVCENCDAVQAVAPAALDAVRAQIRETFGFEAAFGHFPILGVCADCARHVQGGRMSTDAHSHDAVHEHEHTHPDGTTHSHSHTDHDHDHVEHEHEHRHGDLVHSHPHEHEAGLEHDHTHDH